MYKIKLDFYTQYRQFFIHDKGFPIDPNNDRWTSEAYKEKLAIEPGTLSVGIGSYGPLKGELILLDNQVNSIDFSDYDHVVEGSICCESGVLEIIPCMSTEPEISINVTPGNYRVRIYSSGLDTVVEEEGDDYYRIEIWKGDPTDRKVLQTR